VNKLKQLIKLTVLYTHSSSFKLFLQVPREKKVLVGYHPIACQMQKRAKYMAKTQ